jgi:NADPH:quinone reductase-like Zn-dependent oxidoreductase
MRALRGSDPAAGPEEMVVDADVPEPVPGTGDVLVRVAAAGYTPDELTWPSSWVDRSGHDRTPAIPCHEVSGTVMGLGFGTAGLAVGDEVYGLTDWYRDGAAAELICVEARNLALKPAAADHVAMAALPLAGLTASQALFDHGGLAAGQTVLVLGAAGGVGAPAVQLAHAAGARVLAVARAKDHEAVRALGADAAFEDPAEAAGEDVALVVDTVGGEPSTRGRALLRAGGTLVSVAEPPPGDAPDGVKHVYFVVEPDREGLRRLARSVEDGALRAVVGLVVGLDEAPAALIRKQRREVGGKVVIDLLREADA